MRSVTYTDGVKYFADKAHAWWLIDIFATELLGHLRTEGFLVLRCKVKDKKAELSADDGNDSPPVWTRTIKWTDCPEGEWVFFFAPGGPDNTDTILLPGEYCWSSPTSCAHGAPARATRKRRRPSSSACRRAPTRSGSRGGSAPTKLAPSSSSSPIASPEESC